MLSSRDPNQDTSFDNGVNAFWQYVHSKPLLHFVVSEILAGIASISVYGCFVLLSFATEKINQYLPLKNSQPAHFLDLMLAWGAAFSASITFIMITLCSLIRLAVRLTRKGLE